MMGKVSKTATGELSVGPIVLYSRVHHSLKLVEAPIRRSEKDHIEGLQRIADGREDAAVEGAVVFEYLKKAVIRQNVWTLS